MISYSFPEFNNTNSPLSGVIKLENDSSEAILSGEFQFKTELTTGNSESLSGTFTLDLE